MLVTAYKRVLSDGLGFITFNGVIDETRLEALLSSLAKVEDAAFSLREVLPSPP